MLQPCSSARVGVARLEREAAQFGVGISTAINWVDRFHETGSVEPDQIGGYRPKKIPGLYREWLMQRCRKDFTVRGLVAELAERGRSITVRCGSSSTLRSSVTKKTLIAAEQNRLAVAHRRAQWTTYRDRIDPTRLMLIDETWTKANMAPLRGRAPRGQRIKAKVPHCPWQTMTFTAALRHDRITAPWLIEGPINSEAVLLDIENVLVPILRHGDICGATIKMGIRIASWRNVPEDAFPSRLTRYTEPRCGIEPPAPASRIDVAIGFAPVHRLELAGRGREDLADLVVAQRDGGDRGELRGAAVVEGIGIDGEQRAGPVERADRNRSDHDRGDVAVEHGETGGGRVPIDTNLSPPLELRKRHGGCGHRRC